VAVHKLAEIHVRLDDMETSLFFGISKLEDQIHSRCQLLGGYAVLVGKPDLEDVAEDNSASCANIRVQEPDYPSSWADIPFQDAFLEEEDVESEVGSCVLDECCSSPELYSEALLFTNRMQSQKVAPSYLMSVVHVPSLPLGLAVHR